MTADHLNLSNFIKSVHKGLRDSCSEIGATQAWENHCSNTEILEKYACAMKELATNHWETNKTASCVISRLEWTHNVCQNYFFSGELFKLRKKECEIAKKHSLSEHFIFSDFSWKLKLLDVGSCYNPFKVYNYDILAIDLAPANADVMKCDFLNLNLTSKDAISSNSQITELRINSFDIIVFSLLLEYFPSPKQRFLCCEKAYNLLKFEGLLIIITPDSKHVGANAKIMKSWRSILAEMGFSRIKYEKFAHIHCMAFRKSCNKEVVQRWAKLHYGCNLFTEMVIPQDFTVDFNKKKVENLVKDKCDVELFTELPETDFLGV